MDAKERDKLLVDMNDSIGGIATSQSQMHQAIARLEEHSHKPIECPAIAKHETNAHKALADRTRLIFYIVGAIVGLAGAGTAIAKVFF
jgi:hypothetical protein